MKKTIEQQVTEALAHAETVPPLEDGQALFMLQMVHAGAQSPLANSTANFILSVLSGWYVKANQEQFKRILGVKDQ